MKNVAFSHNFNCHRSATADDIFALWSQNKQTTKIRRVVSDVTLLQPQFQRFEMLIHLYRVFHDERFSRWRVWTAPGRFNTWTLWRHAVTIDRYTGSYHLARTFMAIQMLCGLEHVLCIPFSTDGTFPDVPDGSWVDVAFMFSRIFQPSSPQCILNELWTREVFLDGAHTQLFIIWQSFNLRLRMDGELWSHWFLEVFLSPCSDVKASYLFVKQWRPRAWRSQAWILSFSFFQ